MGQRENKMIIMPQQQQQQRQIDDKVDLAVREYLEFEQIAAHRQFIESLIRDKRRPELERLFSKRLAFGTAGIRGCMGAGYGQMNDLVIIQTSQGMASYLLTLDCATGAVRRGGVLIGHDARHNSARFSRLAALAFLQKGIPVHYCDHIVPTPLVAFGVRHYGCYAGIMITASHNPKQDNGYKVYWTNGAQILAPHDAKIQEHIVLRENQRPWPLAWRHELIQAGGGAGAFSPLAESSCPSARQSTPPPPPPPSQQPQQQPTAASWDERLLFRVHGELSKAYFGYIEELVGDRRAENQAASVCITFSAMHGVGHMYLSRALDIAGFDDIFPVESQKKPDPEFSTVRFPNPEEAGALDLAFETAKHANSNLILANDPDSDRCAAALYDPRSDYKRVLDGNEIGALLGWWRWHCFYQQPQPQSHDEPAEGSSSPSPPAQATTTTTTNSDQLSEEDGSHHAVEAQQRTAAAAAATHLRAPKPSDCYMISSAVSSKFLKSMAQIEGFQFVETLTGFKHMGNLADRLIRDEGKQVLFAYEEAIGYMVDSTILDKDGISAAVQLAQCAAHVSTNYQRTLEQQLDWLHSIYGYHFNLNSCYVCSDAAIIGEIFGRLQANYPKQFVSVEGEQTFRVSRVRDLNSGYDSGEPDQRARLPSSPSSYMLTLFVDQDITFTMRTSGTEPKIKYYSEIVAQLPPTEALDDPVRLAAKEAAQRRLQRLVAAAIEHCLRPQHYELESAASLSD